MIVATAGHIDHGKTTLVAALTGIDTDRLPEEKSRGMTIDIGFAYRPITDGPVMGFVDVPGHERFVRNMLAGVAGIDFALLVIAADDGPMAQTDEHLAILDLLGVEVGAVALTKIDLVEADRVDQVERDIHALLSPTALKDAPIFRTSGATGDGVQALSDHLEAAARGHEMRGRAGPFRLAIDRCFSVAGAGLVVTGTAFSGSIGLDDRLVISPTGTPVRVRSIHAQNQKSESGHAGQRLGINLAGSGLARAGVHRGNWLVGEGAHAPANRLDCWIRILPGEAKPLRHWAPVHVHLGAMEVTARVALLRDKSIPPGGEGPVQLVLDEAVGALGRDRLILRDASAQRTIGGGRVIDPFAPSRGRAKPTRLSLLAAMDQPDPAQSLAAVLDVAPTGIDENWFRTSRNLDTASMADLIRGLGAARFGMAEGGVIFSALSWEKLLATIVDIIGALHEDAPELAGLEEQSLRKRVDPNLRPPIFRAILEHMTDQGVVARAGAHLALPGHRPQMTPVDAAVWSRVQKILDEDPFRPPVVHALAQDIGLTPRETEQFLSRVTRLGYLYRTARNRFFLTAAICELARIAETVATQAADGGLEIPAFRSASEIGRNLAVEVLEAFDKAGLTARDGNKRRLLAPAARIFPDV